MKKTFCKVLMLFVMPLFVIFLSACNYHYSRLMFDSNGGTVVKTIEYYPEDPLVEPVTTKEGYTFDGWYDIMGNSFIEVSKDFKTNNEYRFYAKWIALQSSIFFESNGGTSVEAITQDVGTDVVEPENPTKEGYAFMGWCTSPELTIYFVFTTMPSQSLNLYAKWEANPVTISFESNGGSLVESITAGFETVITAPTIPQKEGYTFNGWYQVESFTNLFVFATMPLTDFTLYAKWTINQYTITFDSKGGSAVDPITQEYATSVASPADPTKYGHDFSGWYVDNEFTQPFVFETMPAQNITLFAKWSLNRVGVIFDSNGGSDVETIVNDFGTAISKPADPEKSGYTFVNWFSDEALSVPYEFLTMPGETITLYAKWQINQYTISFNSNGGSAVTAINQDYASVVTAPENPVKDGYTFLGWFDETLTNAYVFSTIPANSLTLYAKWGVNQYSLQFESNGGSSVATITQEFGSNVTAPAAPEKTGYSFVGWFDQTLTTAFVFSTMAGIDSTLYAKWQINQYTIAFNSNGGTEVASITQDFGITVVVPTQPTKVGYTFAGWYDESLTTIPVFSTIPGNNLMLYAKWNVNQYTISFVTNGGSAVSAITQDYNTVLSIPENPTKTGYTFVWWYDEALTSAFSLTLMPAGNLTLYAKWEVNQYSINFVSNGGNDVASIKQDFDSVVIAPADPVKEGYTFLGWFNEPTIATLYSFTKIPAHDVTVYAGWRINHYLLSFESNGGSMVSPSVNDYNVPISIGVSSKTGCTFGGWYTEPEFINLFTANRMPAHAVTLYAKWQNSLYYITNGGTSVPSTVADPGTPVSAPTPPSKDGYSFGGWYYDTNCNAPYTFTVMPSTNTYLTAKWIVNQYSISFETNGGSAVSPITQNYTSVVTAPASPTKSGFVFGNWCSDAALTVDYSFTTMPSSNITLYAKWQTVISFESNGGNAVETIVAFEGSAITAPETAKIGHSFAGWYSDLELLVPYSFTVMPAEPLTFYAKWTINQYTISFVANEGSLTSPMTQDFGSAVSAPFDPTRLGYTFVGWFEDPELLIPYQFTFMPAEDVTVYADWTPEQHTINFSTGASGANMMPITQETDSLVIRPIDPVSFGYYFIDWYCDPELTNAYIFTMMPPTDITLYAKWQFVIYFDSLGGSLVSEITLPTGNALDAPSDPILEGYTFGGWFLDYEGTIPYVFSTMPNESLTLYAKWTINQYSISFVTNGGTAVETITQDFQTVVTRPVDPTKEANQFVDWYTDPERTQPYVFGTMPSQDLILYAKWSVNQYSLILEPNNGDAQIVITQEFGYAVTPPENPVFGEAIFMGWFSQENPEQQYVFTTMPAQDVYLYAQWQFPTN